MSDSSIQKAREAWALFQAADGCGLVLTDDDLLAEFLAECFGVKPSDLSGDPDDPAPTADHPAASEAGGEAGVWRNRPVVLLRERDGRESFVHGVVVGPDGLSCADALTRVDAVFRAVVDADRDEWNYGDVLASLTAAGFEAVRPADWWEHEA
jgi:hypothetical protein